VLGTFAAEFGAPIVEFTIRSPEGKHAAIAASGINDTGANRVCIPRRLAVAAGLRQSGTLDF
jgi:hypothetical protein